MMGAEEWIIAALSFSVFFGIFRWMTRIEKILRSIEHALSTEGVNDE